MAHRVDGAQRLTGMHCLKQYYALMRRERVHLPLQPVSERLPRSGLIQHRDRASPQVVNFLQGGLLQGLGELGQHMVAVGGDGLQGLRVATCLGRIEVDLGRHLAHRG